MVDQPSNLDERSSLLVRLNSALDHYPSALARAAKYIIEHPETVVRQSLAELSIHMGVGQASIIRLCQSLGLEGFAALKLALSAELALSRAGHAEALAVPTDPLGRTADLMCLSITETRKLVDPEVLAKITGALTTARRIDILGSGISGLIAELIAYRLLRLGYPANAMRDVVMAREVAIGLGPRTVVIAVSQSGTTLETLQSLKHARAAGAFGVAVTCHLRSAIAKAADEVLAMAPLREPTYGGPVIDVPRSILIAEALALALPDKTGAKLS